MQVFVAFRAGRHFARNALAAVALIAVVTGLFSPLPAEARPKSERGFSVNSPSITEGTGGTTNLVFTVTLTGFTSKTATVDYATASGTATVPADYQRMAGKLTFPKGTTTKEVLVPVVGDDVDELNETLFLSLSRSTRAKILTGQGTGTIVDDDLPPTVGIGDASVVEGQDGASNLLVFPVRLSAASGLPVSVQYSTSSSSATAGSDYTAVAGAVLSFLPGQLSATATVTVLGDALTEGNETVTVTLSAPINATLGTASAIGTIIDNDPVGNPTVSVADQTGVEGAVLHFSINVSPVSPVAFAVDYVVVGDSATVPGDLPAASGTVQVPANASSVTVGIPTTDDALDEATERFYLNLTSSTGGSSIVVGQAAGFVTDNDPAPTINAVATDVSEGDSAVFGATNTAHVPVRLSAISGQTVTVDYQTVDGSAIAGTDYVSTGGTLTFTPGVTEQSIPVTILGNLVDQPNKTFSLQLSNATLGTIGSGLAVVTILDDEASLSPVVTVGDSAVTEGDAGAVIITFPVTLDDYSDSTVIVNYDIIGPTGAVVGTGSVTFSPGETLLVVDFSVPGDNVAGPNAAYQLVVRSVTGGQFAPGESGTVTVIDNDAAGSTNSVSVSDAVATEGDVAQTVLSFVVTLAQPASAPTTVAFSTAGLEALPVEDFVSASGTLTFLAGQQELIVLVSVEPDLDDELDERLLLNLTSPSTGLRIADGQGIGTILDNDPVGSGLTLSVGDVSVIEAAGGSSATFTVTLSGPAPAGGVTFTYMTTPGTAGSADFTASTGTATIPAGQTTITVSVPVTGDSRDEGSTPETFFLNIVPTTAGIGVVDPQGMGTITDNKALLPVASIGNVTVTQGSTPGTVVVTIPVTLDHAGEETVTIGYSIPSTTGGAPTTGTVTFLPGQTSQTAVVTVPGDATTNIPSPVSLTTSTGAVINPSASSASLAPAGPQIVGTSPPTSDGGTSVSSGEQQRSLRSVATGYRLVAADGGIFAFGDAPFLGSTGNIALNKPIVGMATTPSGDGYWLVASDGGIFSFGDAGFFGSAGSIPLNKPIVGMETTPSGQGYWLVATDGGIFAFGDAQFQGSTGNIQLNRPIVGMETTPSGNGYWLAASDGGIFAFGDAQFQGSTGNIQLNRPIVGMAASPSGNGYRLVATDGGIFSFGDASFLGSTGDITLNKPVVGMAVTPSGNGYWLVATDGGIFTFGDATFLGSTGDIRLNQPVNGMAPVVRTLPVNE